MSDPSKAHVLLIEDDPEFIKHVETTMAALPVQLFVTMTGRDGLKRLAKGDIQIVIVDGLLPDKTGLRIIEDIHTRQFPGKVVFLSAFYTDVRSFKKLTALGVDLVLQKPIEATDLRNKLKPLLPNAPVRPQTMETDFTRQFASLKEDYLEKLQLVWAPEFVKLVERAERDDPTAVAEIKVFCHKLHGTAGIYKQQHISEAAHRLEIGVEHRELARLLPEMKEFLDLLRTANPKNTGEIAAVNLVARFQSVLVVTTSRAVFAEIEDELSVEGVEAHHATSLTTALQGILHWKPDILVVDRQLMSEKYNASVINLLSRYMTGLRILALGDSQEPLPFGTVQVPASKGGVLECLASPSLQPFPGVTLMVCDDNPQTREAVEQIFPPLGITVETVTRPDDYLADIENLRPSLVLMDAAFGAEGGIEMFRIARTEPANREIPTIILSAQTTLAERNRAFQTGAAGYVLKPLATDQLMHEVTRVLRDIRVSRFGQSLLRL